MCATCRKDPEIIPPVVTDEMIPAAIVVDSIDAILVIMALSTFADEYLTVAERIATDPRTTAYAQLVIMSNMTNVSERIVRLIESIESTTLGAPVASDDNRGN